jgi:acyl-CoA thioesterase-1
MMLSERKTLMKHVFWGMLLCFFLIASCGQKPDAEAERRERPARMDTYTLVAMGDSLTEGLGVLPDASYPARLEVALRERGWPVTVINAGVSGETSAGALSRADWIIHRLKPDLVILVTGANDGLRRLPVDAMEVNIRALLNRFEEAGVPVILGGMRMFFNLGPAYVREFEAVYPRLAKEKKVDLIPFFLEGVAASPSMNQPDGIHPNAEGYGEIVRRILPYVEKALTRHARSTP